MSPQQGTAAEGGGRAHHHGGSIRRVCGLRWHGPDPRPSGAGAPVVGAPSRREDYGVVAPPRIWSRGIRNAAHCTSSTPF